MCSQSNSTFNPIIKPQLVQQLSTLPSQDVQRIFDPQLAFPLSVRSDMWAFGCLLYEMAEGKRPFEGGNVNDTIQNILHKGFIYIYIYIYVYG
jgi:serine/threonine protein kinase